jgi:hypothetical protein
MPIIDFLYLLLTFFLGNPAKAAVSLLNFQPPPSKRQDGTNVVNRPFFLRRPPTSVHDLGSFQATDKAMV